MEKITFHCEVITPMFLSGANKNSAELRPPSIKGAMRFWWRAMNGHLSLEELKKKETLIFGGGGKDARKSAFSIKVKSIEIKISKTDIFKSKTAKNPEWYKKSASSNRDIRVNPLEYLGYGPFNLRTKWQKYIQPKSSFVIILLFNKSTDKSIIDEVKKTFLYFMSFGGLGAKNRNGYGQFKVKNIDYIKFDVLTNLNTSSNNNYSYFSDEAKIFRLKEQCSTWAKALALLGEEYRFAKLETDGAKYAYEKRKFIAAPGKEDVFKRKTKPYFLNIWKVTSNDSNNIKFKGLILYLPYHVLIHEKEIYTRSYDKNYEMNLKTACDTFNQKLLSSPNIEEVTL